MKVEKDKSAKPVNLRIGGPTIRPDNLFFLKRPVIAALFSFFQLISAGPSRKAHCRLSWQAACLCGRQALSGGRSISYIRYVLICGRFKTYKRRPFPEASLMLPRTRSAGSFCLDCSHRKLPPDSPGIFFAPDHGRALTCCQYRRPLPEADLSW